MSAGTFFKTFSSSDRTSTRTLLHEAIPITGTLVSGTYAEVSNRGANIKTFSHGMFQSVYDYPHLSSSANHIFDIAVGISTNVTASGGSVSASVGTTGQVSKKVNMYNQMAQMLAGYDISGSIRHFDRDGDLSDDAGHHNVVFLNFSRLLVKDEIKKGSFRLNIGTASAFATPFTEIEYITDAGNETSYKINSPAGEYGILRAGGDNIGLLYYQAGIAVLTASVLGATSSLDSTGNNVTQLLTGSNINAYADAFRHRISNITFNNTTELNSTVYFCRANHNEFNYSSNPTFLTGSKIRVKGEDPTAPTKTYVTTVGLYSADNELLAVAKLSEPLRKDPTNELTLRVRLDY